MNTCGIIYLSTNLATRLGVPLQPWINIRAGNLVVAARMLNITDSKKTYLLSPKLAKALYLPRRKKLQLRYDSDAGMLHIGPIIGLFTTALPHMQAELIYLSKLGRSLPAQIYVFTPAGIVWDKNVVRGFVYQQITAEQGVWSSSYYPLPDVVYDRVATRASENRNAVKNTKRRLMKMPYLKYFNPSFLNKWRVHQLLFTNPDLHPYLPETCRLNAANLDDMLKKYPTLFLKPSNGSLGKGIIKISKSEHRLKYVCYRDGVTHGIVGTHQELLYKTKKFRKNKAYIIQQGINLIFYQGSPFDIRIIYQKNARGEWQIAKKFVRVAARGSSISNLSSGGRAERLVTVFNTLYHGNTRMIKEQNHLLDVLCRQVAATLEKADNAIYGELGLDIGLDQNNFPWLLEVNSKPHKRTETNYSQGVVRNSFKRPLEYAIHLAGFKPRLQPVRKKQY